MEIDKVLAGILQYAPADQDYSELYNKLMNLYEHPLSLNKATKEELAELFFLNEIQINDIISYREKYTEFKSLNELTYIKSLDNETIKKLVLFVNTVENNNKSGLTWSDYFFRGKNEYQLNFEEIAEKQKGYNMPQNDYTVNNHYLGSPAGLSIKYLHDFENKLSFGMTAKKDPGEEFFKGSQKQGFDSYSGYIYFAGGKNLESLVVGDYELSFGQGLVMWSGLSMNNENNINQIYKCGQGVKPYLSSNENNNLRGTAMTWGFNEIKLSVFYSSKKIDAKPALQDSLDYYYGNSYKSFSYTGYHRTPEEVANKNTITDQVTGSHVSFNLKNSKLGFTILREWYSNPFVQNSKVYGCNDFSGKILNNLGTDYSFSYRTLYMFGETGFDGKTLANLTGLLIDFTSQLYGSVVYRNYPANYNAAYSNAFRTSGKTKNEKGLTALLLYQPSGKIKISGYFDQYSFPWLKYRVDNPSDGQQCNLEFQYSPSAIIIMKLKGSYDMNEKNLSGSTTNMNLITQFKKDGISYIIENRLSDKYMIQTQIFYSVLTAPGMANEQGLLTNQDMTGLFFKNRLMLKFGICFFNVQSVNFPIYLYEDNLPGSFDIPVYTDKGLAYNFLCKFQVGNKAILCIKLKRISYFDKSTIGTGADEITGNHKTEIKIALDYRL